MAGSRHVVYVISTLLFVGWIVTSKFFARYISENLDAQFLALFILDRMIPIVGLLGAVYHFLSLSYLNLAVCLSTLAIGILILLLEIASAAVTFYLSWTNAHLMYSYVLDVSLLGVLLACLQATIDAHYVIVKLRIKELTSVEQLF